MKNRLEGNDREKENCQENVQCSYGKIKVKEINKDNERWRQEEEETRSIEAERISQGDKARASRTGSRER